MSERDGGPAFPQLDCFVDANGEKPVYASHGGLTIRDYFAAEAMKPLLTGIEWNKSGGVNLRQVRAVTQEAYVVAEAMLEARKK